MTPLRQRLIEELQRRLSREPDYAEPDAQNTAGPIPRSVVTRHNH